MGHGGSQHKKIGTLAARARQFAQRLGYATLAIDAPGHGDRISREEAERLARRSGAAVQGQPRTPGFTAQLMKTMAERTVQAVPEWKAALDAAQSLPFVGAGAGRLLGRFDGNGHRRAVRRQPSRASMRGVRPRRA